MIKVFEGKYDKSKFYSIMGKYFAEPRYKKELPYLVNRDNTIWFINITKGEVLAFGSLEESKNKITFTEDYFEKDIRSFKTVLKAKMEYLKDNKKPIETATSNPKIEKELLKIGFTKYRETTNYVFLHKEC
ncbi:hypothetical protein [Clostridium luticellarii]|uniref:N-acetyltransferase domain-containing protein n=1 Tax=Clostridium luticellarii TaxID=1691940 RepID=A0A2T0BLQ0_9CLOT|nr:hypothetical protein [Clostridium luticellarii]PRR84763.1 hypothetical protein CLLU_23020 [Clostridium luticellarii]